MQKGDNQLESQATQKFCVIPPYSRQFQTGVPQHTGRGLVFKDTIELELKSTSPTFGYRAEDVLLHLRQTENRIS